MKRMCGIAPLAMALLVVAGCAVVPAKKDDATLSKVAVNETEAQRIIDRYRSVRASAIALLDSKPLSVVEGATVLAIDSGSFEVSQRSAQRQKSRDDLRITDLWIPEFSKYPLWFVALVEDAARDVVKVHVFGREHAATPWLLEAAPRILASTSLPDVKDGPDDTVIAVSSDDDSGMDVSPQKAVNTYVAVLNDPKSANAGAVLEDGFIRQMRSSAVDARALKDVEFSRVWGAKDVQYALRTDDGGALVFATLTRQDRYSVKPGLAVRWPTGSPQQAFLGDELTSSGTLNYYHQILMYMPGGADGKPRVLGQFGGVVGAAGR